MSKETSGKPITIKLDGQLGRALRQYKKATKLVPAEVIRRALVCYWLGQKTQAASIAVNTAEREPDESWAAYLAGDDVEVFKPESDLAQTLGDLAKKVAGVK